jgi:hypothetical protein
LWHWLTHEAAGFFTLWLVIVGGGQLVLFYVQLRLIRESLDDAKIAADAAKISADTGKIQSEIANATLITMKDTAERQLRAYVGIAESAIEGADYRTFSFVVHNKGQTPAYKIMAYLNRYRLAFGEQLPEGFAYSDFLPPISSSVVIPPNDKRTMYFTIADLQTDIQMVKASTAALFIYGHVDYFDAFDNFRQSFFSYQYSHEGGRHALSVQRDYNHAT